MTHYFSMVLAPVAGTAALSGIAVGMADSAAVSTALAVAGRWRG